MLIDVNYEMELIYLLREYNLTIKYKGKSWILTVEHPYNYRAVNRNLLGALLELSGKVTNG